VPIAGLDYHRQNREKFQARNEIFAMKGNAAWWNFRNAKGVLAPHAAASQLTASKRNAGPDAPFRVITLR
jgi:hypothetical protein